MSSKLDIHAKRTFLCILQILEKRSIKMIKLLTLGIALFAVLSLTTCGGASTPSDPPNNTLPQQNQNDRSHGDNGTAPTPYPFDEELLSGGIYEGELDANGRFTGYGVWIYYSNRYEGYFVDGLPNGEGTLHLSNDAWDVSTTYTGTFINGSAQGLVTRIDINKSDV